MDDILARIMTQYTASAAAYVDWWAPALEQFFEPSLKALPVPAGVPRVLDLGCGAGNATRRMARRLPAGCLLVGGDLVSAMLERARVASPGSPLVRFDAARLPFADRVFDLVISTFAIHHVREQRRTMGEVHRVLKPGGKFQLVGWGGTDPGCPAMTAWDNLLTEAGAPPDDPEPPPAWQEEIAVPGAIEAMLTSIGFQVAGATRTTDGFAWTPESLAGVRLGVGGGRRRFLALAPAKRLPFEARARKLLSKLPAADFVWRPEVVSVLAGKSGDPAADYRTICPNCGAEMYDRGCKTRCPRCHFFTDCSDPW